MEVDPSRASGTRRPEVWELGYHFDGPLKIDNEVLTQARCLGFIVVDSRKELLARRSEEMDPHSRPQPGSGFGEDLLGWNRFETVCIKISDAPLDLLIPSPFNLRIPVEAGDEALGELGPLLRREEKGGSLKRMKRSGHEVLQRSGRLWRIV